MRLGGRPPSQCRQALLGLLRAGAHGDHITLARAAGMDEGRVHQTVRDMAREGLIERCATVATGRRPRNVYRAATSRQAGHEALARLMFHAWA